MNRSTAFFILIALALSAYIYLVESKEMGTKEKEAVEKKLFTLTSAKIDKLTVTHEESSFELVKKGTEWSIVKPFNYPADLSTVEQILSELEFVETRRTIPVSEIPDLDSTLKQWNLSPPATKIIASGEGKTYELIIGRKIAVNDLYYARKSSDKNAPVELISSFSRNNFDKKLNDLRSKDILKFVSTDVRKISLKQSKGETPIAEEKELTLEKDQWSLQKPIKARADREQINSWISNALGLKVIRFVSDDSSNLSIYGLSSPKSQIAFGFDGKSDQTLLIGSTATDQATEVYAKRLQSNTIFTVKIEGVQKLLNETSEWRDKHVLPSFSQNDVTGFKIDFKSKPASFEKENGQWSFVGTPSFAVENDKVVNLINSLQDLKSTQFVKDTRSDLKTYGLDKPTSRIVLEGKKGDEPFKLELILGKTDKSLVYAMSSSEPFIFAIPSSFGSDWPKELWQWRSLNILTTHQDQLQKVVISDRKGIRTTLLHNDQGKWELDNKTQTLNEPAKGSLLSRLSSMRAVRWVGVAPSPSYDLQSPVLKLEITSNKETKILKIGASLPTGGRVAQLDNMDAFFEITQPDFETLNQNIIAPATPTTAKPLSPEQPK
ncbi:MAG: DUF4340 domain-containing protein [Verrucomicrobiota bacterium]